MNKYLKYPVFVLIVYGLFRAYSSFSYPDFSGMSSECEDYFRMYVAYLDKLEDTGRFSPDKMACFRRQTAGMMNANRNRASHQEEAVSNMCRGGQKVVQEIMQKVENIPNLSQEEFDADWGRIECR